jgi:hypothetical protein
MLGRDLVEPFESPAIRALPDFAGKRWVHQLRETETAATRAATLVNRPLVVAVVGVGAIVVLTM